MHKVEQDVTHLLGYQEQTVFYHTKYVEYEEDICYASLLYRPEEVVGPRAKPSHRVTYGVARSVPLSLYRWWVNHVTTNLLPMHMAEALMENYSEINDWKWDKGYCQTPDQFRPSWNDPDGPFLQYRAENEWTLSGAITAQFSLSMNLSQSAHFIIASLMRYPLECGPTVYVANLLTKDSRTKDMNPMLQMALAQCITGVSSHVIGGWRTLIPSQVRWLMRNDYKERVLMAEAATLPLYKAEALDTRIDSFFSGGDARGREPDLWYPDFHWGKEVAEGHRIGDVILMENGAGSQVLLNGASEIYRGRGARKAKEAA